MQQPGATLACSQEEQQPCTTKLLQNFNDIAKTVVVAIALTVSGEFTLMKIRTWDSHPDALPFKASITSTCAVFVFHAIMQPEPERFSCTGNGVSGAQCEPNMRHASRPHLAVQAKRAHVPVRALRLFGSCDQAKADKFTRT